MTTAYHLPAQRTAFARLKALPWSTYGLAVIVVAYLVWSLAPVVIPVVFEEAAMDLGASPLAAFRLVLVPLLQPAILASAVVAFAVSIDDFVITQYMSSDASTQTVPMLIYNTGRGSAPPALNAAATV